MAVSTLNVIAVLGFICLAKDGSTHRFGYGDEEQKLWESISEDCAEEMQSPINIVSHRAVPEPLPALEVVYYHNLLPYFMKLVNTGHSVALQLGEGNEDTPLPRIFGARLSSEYELHSLHFHWGHKNSRGSEHVLSGNRFPIEMHIIHRNMKYKDLAEAMAKRDGLTVLAFFFQVREKINMNLEPLLRAFPYVRMPHQEVTLNETFTLASLVETDLDVYYTYLGSLTSPPCSEAVTWIIFPDPLFISFRQIKRFRRIMSGETKMGNNFRSPQLLNNRTVYVRKMWRKSRPKKISLQSTS